MTSSVFSEIVSSLWGWRGEGVGGWGRSVRVGCPGNGEG